MLKKIPTSSLSLGLSLLVLSSVTFSSCRSRSEAAMPGLNRGVFNSAVASQNVRVFNARRNLKSLIDKHHAELIQRNRAMVDLKYRAMATSPFVFYRATAFLFYHDVASEKALSQALKAPLQGDFHLENLGTYRTAQGTFGYDLNDFDEAVTGPFSWDLARLGTSIHLAASEVGLSSEEREAMVVHFLSAYAKALNTLQRQPGLYKAPLDERHLTEKPAKEVMQARERFNRAAWLQEKAPNGRFPQDDKMRPVPPGEVTQLQQAIQTYVQTRREGPGFFAVKDTAMRIAGKGSLGRYRYSVRVEGPTPASQDDILLEFKEAAPPSASYAGIRSSSSDGARIVNAYRRFLPGADPYLGVTRLGKVSAYVREWLPDEAVKLEKVNKVSEYRDFLDSVALIIARAHSRNGKAAQMASQIPQLAPEIAAFAGRYAEQVNVDWRQFKAEF